MSEGPRITPDEVRAVARLAHLEIGDDELPRLTRDLGQILGYVAQLSELDVSDVPPTLGGLATGALHPRAATGAMSPGRDSTGARSPGGASLPEGGVAAAESLVAAGSGADLGALRADTPVPSLPAEEALREAPRARDGGFAVPAFVDEG
ncbi:MAG: Asp-tRNA(Asn)/Glu-tRNA(Gln) amidotransferase subunit GatC [Polyangiaceae bacterium]